MVLDFHGPSLLMNPDQSLDLRPGRARPLGNPLPAIIMMAQSAFHPAVNLRALPAWKAPMRAAAGLNQLQGTASGSSCMKHDWLGCGGKGSAILICIAC
jgi:hypothetical protein